MQLSEIMDLPTRRTESDDYEVLLIRFSSYRMRWSRSNSVSNYSVTTDSSGIAPTTVTCIIV